MITRDDASRLAVMTNTLRPTWSEASVMAVIGDERIRLRRTYRDTAVALAYLALDSSTQKPTRLFEAGPWWASADAAMSAGSGPTYRYPDLRDCRTCGKPQAHPHLEHDYEPAFVAVTNRAKPDVIAVRQAAIESAKPLPVNETTKEK